jgi:hypothetical protein
LQFDIGNLLGGMVQAKPSFKDCLGQSTNKYLLLQANGYHFLMNPINLTGFTITFFKAINLQANHLLWQH